MTTAYNIEVQEAIYHAAAEPSSLVFID
ncbi:type I toxin-antitoxin system ptaRNA1 family toxin [Zobellella sp. CGMCC 1.18722]|uniref:Type I toxin-antitoxin system ptaRNA1 family toxin n=1 Tax=Zobellella iuensis TaxID=2803811 RepID=A0ABS1QSW9_9GAMM|nr:type I toxin-antitoxin system ptaRNA1 family toxin [Zobellella iuensis]